MGACLSCLGLRRQGSQSDPSEGSRLLYDDPYHAQYGSVASGMVQGYGLPQNPEGLRLEREIFDSICAQTSDKLVDVSPLVHVEDRTKITSDYDRFFTDAFSSDAYQEEPETLSLRPYISDNIHNDNESCEGMDDAWARLSANYNVDYRTKDHDTVQEPAIANNGFTFTFEDLAH